MALDRAWYNSLIDDDGSNTVGSVWDKADVNALMNTIDAEIGRVDTTTKHPFCEVYLLNGNGQSIPTATFTVVLFDTELADPAGMWSGSDNSKIIIPQTGTYHITGQVFWDTNTTGVRIVQIYLNGVAVLPDAIVNPVTGGYTPQQNSGVLYLDAGTYLQVVAYQNSGAAVRTGGFGAHLSTNRIRVDRLY